MSTKKYNRGSLNGAVPTNAAESPDFRANVWKTACEIDTYENRTVFTVRVVSPPYHMNNEVTTNNPAPPGEASTVVDGSNAFKQFSFRGRLLENEVLVPHLLVPPICELAKIPGSDKEKQRTAIGYATMYIQCTSKMGYAGDPPQLVDLVRVILSPGDVGPVDCQVAYFDEIEVLTAPETSAVQKGSISTDCAALSELFGGSASGGFSSSVVLGGPAKVRSDAKRTLAESERVPEGKMVNSQMAAATRTLIRTGVMSEYAFWQEGKKKCPAKSGFKCPEDLALDKTSVYYTRMALYWRETFIGDGKAPEEIDGYVKNNMFTRGGGMQHWSAVYISYIMRRAFKKDDTKFYVNTAHHYYMTGGKKRGWKVYDTMNSQGKIKAEVGDILITPYDGAARDTPNTHGDVVYAIAHGKAHTSGGNIGQNVSISRNVTLDNEGFYRPGKSGMKSPGSTWPYLVVMKYKPKESPYTGQNMAHANNPSDQSPT